jgi:hypothetical protein
LSWTWNSARRHPSTNFSQIYNPTLCDSVSNPNTNSLSYLRGWWLQVHSLSLGRNPNDVFLSECHVGEVCVWCDSDVCDEFMGHVAQLSNQKELWGAIWVSCWWEEQSIFDGCR